VHATSMPMIIRWAFLPLDKILYSRSHQLKDLITAAVNNTPVRSSLCEGQRGI